MDLDALDQRISELREDVRRLADALTGREDAQDDEISGLDRRLLIVERDLGEILTDAKMVIAAEKAKNRYAALLERVALLIIGAAGALAATGLIPKV